VRIGEHAGDLLDADARAGRDHDTELATEAAQCIDARGAGCHPQRAGAVQALQCLLLDRFDAHRDDLGTAHRLEQGGGIGRIGLVALDVRTDVSRRQQLNLDAQSIEPARPVVGGATGLHDNPSDRSIDEPALELTAREAVALDDLPLVISDGELEDVLCQVNGDGRSIHLGLLPVRCADRHTT
jgi:hypothetical protein